MCLLTTIHPLTQTEQPEPLTKAIDVWALGITLYSLLFGKPPFQADTVFLLWKVIPNQPLPEPPFMGCDAIPSRGHDEGEIVMSILRRLLDKDPKTRLTLDQVKVRTLGHCYMTAAHIEPLAETSMGGAGHHGPRGLVTFYCSWARRSGRRDRRRHQECLQS